MTIRGVLTLLLTSTMTLATNAQNEVMTPEKLWELQRVSLAGVSPDGSTVLYNITQYDVAANQGTTRIAACNLSGQQRQLTDGTQSAQAIGFTPSGRVAYLQQGQLWTMTPAGEDARQATHIEGGIENVLFSPKGDAVLFTRQVKYRPTTAELYPELPKANARIIDDLMYRHWNTWEDDKVSHVFYAPFNGTEVSGEGTDIMAGQPYDSPLTPFGGAEQLAWSPDGLKIAYTCKKKQGTAAAISTDSDIYLYDIVSGKTENLTQGNGGYDTNPAWSPDGRFLAWLSMDEDGYEADKNDIKILEWATGHTYNLTERWDETVEAFAWEKNSLSLVFRTAFNGVEQLFEYSLPKDLSQLAPNQDITQLTKEKTCTGAFIPTGKYIIAERYDFNRPNELVAYDLKRKTIRPLTDVNGPAMQSIAPSPVQARWVTTTDGRQMLVWMVFPPHFDPDKKYPALLFCGGGPQSPLTPDYSFRWNFQLMAAKGYVVVIPNRPGASGLRCQVERGGIRCLGRTSHHRPADRHRRRSARTLHRPRASGGGRSLLRGILGLYAGRKTPGTLQDLYRPLRHVRHEELVRDYRGDLLCQQRPRRSLLAEQGQPFVQRILAFVLRGPVGYAHPDPARRTGLPGTARPVHAGLPGRPPAGDRGADGPVPRRMPLDPPPAGCLAVASRVFLLAGQVPRSGILTSALGSSCETVRGV